MEFRIFESSDTNVYKYVFTKEDMVAEAVLYRYGDFYKRTVICCSTMSGCPVGCTFCGTGKRFVRNLTEDEIVAQITTILKDKNIEDVSSKGERFQIMFMSMGEPMLNWKNVRASIVELNKLYPNAELLLSTVGIKDAEVMRDLLQLSVEIDKIGLQFSIHKSNDEDRTKLIPFKGKMNLEEIRDFGTVWWKSTNRRPFLNYCVDGTNDTEEDYLRMKTLFSREVFNLTFSVVCSADESIKDACFRNEEVIDSFAQKFMQAGYNVRTFNPAGQDDIGGGCGQLWFTQDWIKARDIKLKLNGGINA